MIILYHNVFPDCESPEFWWAGQAMRFTVFKRHILWLAKNHRIVSLDEYLSNDRKTRLGERKPVAITFDDGLQLTFKCVSTFLVDKNIPATFFVPTSHLEHGELLWFSYLDALCTENPYDSITVNGHIYTFQTLALCKQAKYTLTLLAKQSGNPVGFCKNIAKTYPIPGKIASKYEGMTYDQLMDVGRSNVLKIGAHTITHPFLDRLPKNSQAREILDGKKILTELTGEPVRYFAYPGGEYNLETVELVKAAGFDASFAIIPKDLGMDPKWEIARVGIYSESLLKLQMKTMGVAALARQVGLRVG